MPNKVRSHENLQAVSAMINALKNEENKTDQAELQKFQLAKNNIYK